MSMRQVETNKKDRKQTESGRLCGSVQGAVGQSQPLVLPGGRTKVSGRNKKKGEGGAVGSATSPRRLREKEAAGQSFRLRE